MTKPTQSKQIRQVKAKKLLWPLAFAIITVIIIFIASWAHNNVFHKADAAVDKHAANAAAAINDQSGLEVSTSDLAYKVVGSTGGATIDALQAAGTNFNGKVVLRISSDVDSGLLTSDSETHCYAYDFKKYMKVTESKLATCPNMPVLTLPMPRANTYNPKTAP